MYFRFLRNACLLERKFYPAEPLLADLPSKNASRKLAVNKEKHLTHFYKRREACAISSRQCDKAIPGVRRDRVKQAYRGLR